MSDFETPPRTAVLDEYLSLASHDAFSYGGLNRSAAVIYWCLIQQPVTPTQLARRSGRGRATVYRALQRMSKIVDRRTGEVLCLVERSGRVWRVCPAPDLDRIAMVLGTAGKGRRKRAEYEHQREEYRRRLRERGLGMASRRLSERAPVSGSPGEMLRNAEEC